VAVTPGMEEPTSARELFKGRHFDREIIVLCVRWYLTFKLSSRDLVQMMAERGIVLAHTTILRWVQR
jgi:transposase-like protein